jgi:L-lysine 6-transaminase
VGRLQGLAEEFPHIVSNARGRGLFAAFDVASGDLRTSVRTKCLKKGLIILPSGERSMRFRPPLNVSRKEIDEGIGIIVAAFKEV